MRSSDALHDIQIAAGQPINLQLHLRMIAGPWPAGFGDTYFSARHIPRGDDLRSAADPPDAATEVPALGPWALAMLVAGVAALPFVRRR